MPIAALLDLIIKAVVLGALVYAGVVGATYWAVRERRLNPFGAWPRFVRRIGDPVVRPIERRVLRFGGNPQQAPLWLFGIVIAGGLLLITVTGWLVRAVYRAGQLGAAGVRGWLILLFGWAFDILMIALIVRVIASWFGASRYTPWMRPLVFLTDWLLEPIRRRMPPVGMLDLSPLVAYFVLWLLRMLILGALRSGAA